MFKKIFLWAITLLIFIGGYFYFFPIYPDYGILEDYFHTKHYDKTFNSQENGFHELKDLLSFLEKQEDILKLDAYAKCVPNPNRNKEKNYEWEAGYQQWSYDCLRREKEVEEILEWYTREEIQKFSRYLSLLTHAERVNNLEKQEYLKNEFLSDADKQIADAYIKSIQAQESLKKLLTQQYHKDILQNQDFKDSIEIYFEYMDIIVQKPYISSLDLDTWVFEQPNILYSPIIQYQRILRYYILSELEYWDTDKAIEVYTKNYESLIHIYNTIDGELLENLFFITLIWIQQDLWKYMLEVYDLSNVNLSFLEEVFSEEIFWEKGMQNSLKRDYIYGTRVLFEETFNEETLWFSPKTLFMYSEKDTRNIMKYQSKQHINNLPILDVQVNGRNWIGRTLATWWTTTFSSQFRKAEAMETKRKILLDLLLSN